MRFDGFWLHSLNCKGGILLGHFSQYGQEKQKTHRGMYRNLMDHVFDPPDSSLEAIVPTVAGQYGTATK
jgi:hypothetical protein